VVFLASFWVDGQSRPWQPSSSLNAAVRQPLMVFPVRWHAQKLLL